MCGIVGAMTLSSVNQLLYDSLLLLQHRGQDAAGIATYHDQLFNMYKGAGLVRDVFRTRNMRSLPGNCGIGQVRYPTSGSSDSLEEAQPFYVSAPFGIVFAHNGNLTNTAQLRQELFLVDKRHLNTRSDSEVLLNVLAHELGKASGGVSLDPSAMFKAVEVLHQRVSGSYAVVSHVAGYGMLAFRDPYGIRPLVIGHAETEKGNEWMIASESVAFEGLGFKRVRDVEPGEAIFIDYHGNLTNQLCAKKASLNPCIFEYVYLARPDSVMDGVSVYGARLKMGEYLANTVRNRLSLGDIDVVMPIPDSSRPAAMQLAAQLNITYREGLIKNRYIGRTFIMPGQAVRKKSVRQKLNAMSVEFEGKSVLLIDDSIVRGTTSREIVDMAREAGAKKVYFASAAPAVRFPNVYGIDMPSRKDLIAYNKTEEEVARMIGADALIYQNLADTEASVRHFNPHKLTNFEVSCFNGEYITGDITEAYLQELERTRGSEKTSDSVGSQGTFKLSHSLTED